VVADLASHGHRVRVLTRDRSRAELVLTEKVDVVEVDVRLPAGLADAVDATTTVISAVHGFLGGRGAGPAEVDVLGNAHLLAAARDAGAEMVLLSAIGAAVDSQAELLRAKHAAECALRSSGVPWSIVRAGPFIETWASVLRDTARRTGRPLVLGRGLRPMAFVSVLDVAKVVARAATDPTLRGHVMEVGAGPMSMLELARAVQQADGRTEAPRHLPRTVLRLGAILTSPVSPAFARKNRMALVMDTTDLGEGDFELRDRLALPPPTSVGDALGATLSC